MEIDEKQVSDPERYGLVAEDGRRAQDMDMMGDMPAMMLIGTLFWIAVILAIGASIWWAIRRGWPTRRDPALDVLRERYARGEISREEFEARRRDLDA